MEILKLLAQMVYETIEQEIPRVGGVIFNAATLPTCHSNWYQY